MKKRKVSLTKLEVLPVSKSTKDWFMHTSSRWGIPVSDLLEIICYNIRKEPIFDCLKCKFCGKENWRDNAGLIYEMYEVKEGKCTACQSEDYPFDPFSDLEFVQ